MSKSKQFRFRGHVVVLLIAILVTACGGAQAEPTAIPTQVPTETPVPAPPTAVPTPGPGPAFEEGVVMQIPGIAKAVGPGSCEFEQADEPDMVLITIDGTALEVDDLTCTCCLQTITIGPDVRVSLEKFFAPKEQPGVSMTMNMTLKGPIAEETEAHILAGPEGAILTKEGDGFSLVYGVAFYVDK